MTEDQWHWPPPGIANPLGATYAHVAVSEDVIVHSILQGGAPLLATTFPGRTGMSEPMPMPGPGWDDYGAWARRLHVDGQALREYAAAAFAASEAYVGSLTDADIDRQLDLAMLGGTARSLGWMIGRLLIGHTDQVCGEISCLRGLQGLKGM